MIAKLVNITPISLWFMVLISIVFMGFINQLLSRGLAHCMFLNRDTRGLLFYRDNGDIADVEATI